MALRGRTRSTRLATVLQNAQAASSSPRLTMGFHSPSAKGMSAALATLTSRATLARPLLQAVAAGTFARRELTALHARQLRNLKDTEVTTLLDRVWGRTGESSADAKATIGRLRQTFRDAPTWAYDLKAGRAVFDRLCASCHAMNGSAAGSFSRNKTCSREARYSRNRSIRL